MNGTLRPLLPVLIVLYSLAILVLTGVNHFGAEHWWFGALNFYLPQVLWAVPGVLLLMAAIQAGTRWAWGPALCLLWVLGPIMGFRWTTPKPASPGTGPCVRVMTCNAKYGRHDGKELLKEIDRYQPQVVLLQDAVGILQGPLASYFRAWHTCSFEQYLIASRGPITGARVLWVASSADKLPVLRCVTDLGGIPVACYSVHLQSPRDSLNAFRLDREGHWHPLDAIHELEQSASVRLQQAQGLGQLLKAEPGPVLLAGDLNSPENSRVCATLKEAGLQEAFSQGGRGYGYSYGHFLLRHRIPWLHFSWMRLDHIMTSPQMRVLWCWVGTWKVSDHRPVIAELAWTAQGPAQKGAVLWNGSSRSAGKWAFRPQKALEWVGTVDSKPSEGSQGGPPGRGPFTSPSVSQAASPPGT
jgi:endonuclease/exonuclease/phosphatase (EEP) superfamily protein YafD